MGKLHAAITLAFWAAWLAVVYWGSHFVFARWPFTGNVLGVGGTLLLFFPNASDMAWDVARRMRGLPLGPAGRPLLSSQGYVSFSWLRVWITALGITLIGMGFGVGYLAA